MPIKTLSFPLKHRDKAQRHRLPTSIKIRFSRFCLSLLLALALLVGEKLRNFYSAFVVVKPKLNNFFSFFHFHCRSVFFRFRFAVSLLFFLISIFLCFCSWTLFVFQLLVIALTDRKFKNGNFPRSALRPRNLKVVLKFPHSFRFHPKKPTQTISTNLPVIHRGGSEN